MIIPKSVAFEISNRCNYSHLHKRCPTAPLAEPVFLPTDIIKSALIDLAKINWSGNLYFNIYNEPLIDPRLFMLVEFARLYCRGGRIQLFTNGWSLNQYMVDELIKAGVETIFVSRYTDSEEARIGELDGIVGSRIILEPKVMTIYSCPPVATGPCLFPSVYSSVNHKGQFVLCCRDYEYRHVIGDLNTVSFKEVLMSETRNEICTRLANGDRFLDTCKRCPFPGWGVENA